MKPIERTTARTRDAATARKAAEEPDKTGTAVTKAGGANIPAHLRTAMEVDKGQGVSQDQADSMVPLIYILQGLSPQVNERDPAYVEGARAGDIWLRNAPRPIAKGADGILVQPCFFYKDIGEWVPRSEGGGFVARHPWSDKNPDGVPEDAKKVKVVENGNTKEVWVSPRGTEYIPTRNHVVLVHDPDGMVDPLPYVLPLTGSGHSASRQWTFMMRSKTLNGQVMPSYAMLYRLPTAQRKNKAGSWFMIDPKDAGTVSDPAYATEEQYAAGKALFEAFSAGAKTAEAPVASNEDGDGAPGDAGGKV